MSKKWLKLNSAETGIKTGNHTDVGFFIPLPSDQAAAFPSLGAQDKSPPHVTFLYVGAISKESEGHFLQVVEKALSNAVPKVRARTSTAPEYFVQPVQGTRVAVLPVRFSFDMAALRWRLREALLDAGFQVADSFPLLYKPHVTLEYLEDLDTPYKGTIPRADWVFSGLEIWGLPSVVTVPLAGAKMGKKAMTQQKSVALMKFLSEGARKLGVAEHIYVVGGAVRNWVIKEPIKDIDVVVDQIALKRTDASDWFAKQVQKAIPVETSLVTNNYGVAILTIKGDWELAGESMAGEVIEIANTRKESYGGAEGKGYKPHLVEPADIAEDVLRREFSVNTLLWRLYDLAEGPDKAEILDLTGCGLRDLKEGWLRCPSDPDKTFADDPSRMIRSTKFFLKYGFKLSSEVEAAIRRNKEKLHNIPAGHLSNMLIGTFFEPGVGKKALLEMDRLGLLDVIRDIARTDKAFQQALGNWADSRASLDFVFDLMDLGMPSGKRLNFLTPAQKDRVRQIVVQMSAQESDAFVKILEQPGKVLDMPSFIQEFGLQGAEIRRLLDAARHALMLDPKLIGQREKWTTLVRDSLQGGMKRQAAEAQIVWDLVLDWKSVLRVWGRFIAFVQEFQSATTVWPRVDVAFRQDNMLAVVKRLKEQSPERLGSVFLTRPLGKWLDLAGVWELYNEQMLMVRGEIQGFLEEAQDYAESPKPSELQFEKVMQSYTRAAQELGHIAEDINKELKQAGPLHFEYQGFKVRNPGGLPDKAVKASLDGIAYVLALFRKKGAESVLRESVRGFILYSDLGPRVAGFYSSQTREIVFSAQALKEKRGRLFSNWVHEVFLHEIGHHVHMSLLSPGAKAEWDSPWKPIKEAPEKRQQSLEGLQRLTENNRVKYFEALRYHSGNIVKVVKTLSSVEKVKFHAWLREPLSGDPFVTPKQLRWTQRGRRLQEALQNPYAEENRLFLQRVQEGSLAVTWPATYSLNLDPQVVEEFLPEAAEALKQQLGSPSDYALSDELEDFAETFVLFMTSPEKLSPTARFRMQRTLWLSGMGGKPVMRIAQRWLRGQSSKRVASRFLATTLKFDVSLVAKLKSDLRRMTEVYRSLMAEASGRGEDTEASRQEIKAYLEAKALFRTFRLNLDRLLFRTLLQQPEEATQHDLEKETWQASELRAKAWGAVTELGSLFPETWDYKTDTYIPAPWEMVRKREQNIRRYQESFRELWKALAEYIRSEAAEDGVVTRHVEVDETFSLGSTKVVIRYYQDENKDWTDREVKALFQQLRQWITNIERVFPKATQDLVLVVHYSSEHRGASGVYEPRDGQVHLYPWGLQESTFVHEVGHRYWYRVLPPNAKHYWEKTVQSKQGEFYKVDILSFMQDVYQPVWAKIKDKPWRERRVLLQRYVEGLQLDPKREAAYLYLAKNDPAKDSPEEAEAWFLQFYLGQKYQLDSVSDYGNTNPGEAFAEAFMLYVTKGPGALSEWNRWFLKEITRAGGAKFAALQYGDVKLRTKDQWEMLDALQWKTKASTLAEWLDWPLPKVKRVLLQLLALKLISVDAEGWLVDFKQDIFNLLPLYKQRNRG